MLMCSLMLLLRKPSPLRYTTYLHECALSLSKDPQHPSDLTLVYEIQHFRICEAATDAFDHGSRESMQEIDEAKIKVLTRTLMLQLNNCYSSLPPLLASDGEHYCLGPLRFGLTSAVRFARYLAVTRAYVHEVGLYQAQTLSSARSEIILECFSAARMYLDSFLECSMEELASWTILDWRATNYAIMIVSRSATILESFGFAGDSRLRESWIEECLDNAVARVKTLQSITTSNPNSFLEGFASEWKHAKHSYQKGARQAHGENVGLDSTGLTAIPFVDTSFDMDAVYNMSWSSFGLDSDPSNVVMF